jgi:hypothetical protein
MGWCAGAPLELRQLEEEDRIVVLPGRLTRVRRDVFPEPLGPTKSIEGRVVSPLALKTTEWRKMGIVRAKMIAIISPIGDGLRRACAQSCMVDIDGIV